MKYGRELLALHLWKKENSVLNVLLGLNPQAPVAQKTDFWYVSFGEYQFKPFQILFFSGFYIKIISESNGLIAYSNEWNWREKKTIHTKKALIALIEIKNLPIFWQISDWSALIRTFLRNGVWGGQPIGRVRVNFVHSQKILNYFMKTHFYMFLIEICLSNCFFYEF